MKFITQTSNLLEKSRSFERAEKGKEDYMDQFKICKIIYIALVISLMACEGDLSEYIEESDESNTASEDNEGSTTSGSGVTPPPISERLDNDQGIASEDRLPSPLTIKQIHSGHSLTDNAMFMQPWPGHSIPMWQELNPDGDYYDLIGKSTIPGSPMFWRWANDQGQRAYPVDARDDIADFELLVITEGVPFNLGQGTEPGSWWYSEHLEWMRTFTEHAWNNGNSGNGTTTLLYATWTEMPVESEADWRAELDSYQGLWEQMADYGAANLPPEAFVYIIPGNILMMVLYDDIEAGIVPGITDIREFFADDIHLNGLGAYAIALLHIAVIHHINPNIMGHTGYNLSPEPSQELATYLQTIVWDIARNYQRAGVP